jgi:hypothetical protein
MPSSIPGLLSDHLLPTRLGKRCLGLLIAGCLGGLGQLIASDAERFLAAAEDVLPTEERYTYHRSFLSGSIHRPGRDPTAVPTAEEMEVAAEGWSLCYSETASQPLRWAVEDTREFLEVAMDVKLRPETYPLEAALPFPERAIVVGTPATLPNAAALVPASVALRASKDYAIAVRGGRIFVVGWDEPGAMHGLFHLQSRWKLRRAPCLPKELELVRHSRYPTRMILSWLGWMEWPDNYLAHLVHDGYDAIFASVYANPNGVAGPPHYDLIRPQDPEQLQALIERAQRFGIKVYCPILFNYTGTPENQQELRAHVRDIVRRFPAIRGYILLTEGFFYKKFVAGSSAHGDFDMEEWSSRWTEAVRIVLEEAQAIDDSLEILPWEYNIDFRPERAPLKRKIISMLPEGSRPLLTWENGKQFEIDGLKGYLRDYSISQIGPSEVAAAQIEEAQRRRLKVYCKVDCFATWQFGTVPYLPCAQQWQARYAALAKAGIHGTLESWSNGYKPNLFAELRCWSCWTNAPTDQELLLAYARRTFGAEAAERVVQAWEHFSRAVRLLPDTGPSMGTNNAVAQPLFFQPQPPRIMTLHHSWWDESKKTPWRHQMVEAWPYCHRMMVFQPDFSNRRHAAEDYARQRSGIGRLESAAVSSQLSVLPVFRKYVQRAADELEQGLYLYRQAALEAAPELRPGAMREVLIPEQMLHMLRSLDAILDFEQLRLQLAKTTDRSTAEELLDRLTAIAEDESRRTQRALRLTELDSRLGYQMEMDYVYSPLVLEEKLQLLQRTITREIPAYRRKLAETTPAAR